jgi:hypothetical protein
MRHVFVDESSQNAHRFMVLGALIVPGAEVAGAEHALSDLLADQHMRAELKWTKVSRGKLPAYRSMIAFYFDQLVPKGAEFHAVIVNCQELDHGTYNEGDAELGFNKFLFNLLHFRVARNFGHFERIVVDLDSRNATRDPMELQAVLNMRFARETRDVTRPPFARVAFRDSKSTRLLQLSDLMTGAIAWHKNQHDAAPEASASKCEMAEYVASRVGLRRLGDDAPRREVRLSCWTFQLRPRKGRPAV